MSSLDLAWPILQCYNNPWQTDNFYEENNLYNVGLTRLVQPQATKMKSKAKYASQKEAFKKYFLRQIINVTGPNLEYWGSI